MLPGSPPGRPYRALWETDPSNFWRDDRYPGRSFQRIRKDRADRKYGLLQAKQGRRDLWALTSDIGPEIKEDVGPSTRLIDLAIWFGRKWDVPDLPALQTRFLEEFPLDQDALIGNVYTDEIPASYLAEVLSQEPLSNLAVAEIVSGPISLLPCQIDDSDPRLQTVQALLRDGYAGIIFSGPPGTSKTWYAAQIAAKLAEGDPSRVRFIQFHASYQYEDFVEGFVPVEDGFELQPKHLLQMCEVARNANGQPCFLVIDELSRSDPSRVFGEALTYIESSKRDITFQLASGTDASIPPNLYFLATMNEFDRGVDEVDIALERRFARLQMNPDLAELDIILTGNSMDEGLRNRVTRFFLNLQSQREERVRLGHAYFNTARDEETLRRLWDHQLSFLIKKAYRLTPDSYQTLERAWNRIFERQEHPAMPVAPAPAEEQE